ncbi:class I SAM-dependent methyltransferase [Pectobacterium sp. FL60-S17]|uniref:Class I SAM-dependent methyltransferase n=1 Tax=Pectobacterium quasiaquaticum TaxID=2774015 RepID=A0A9Q2EPT2_9GAMM|nr:MULTISPECIES: cyclopropane-fatty-acyl-phospholipid synthase family protein [Pectobacterium]MBE5201983.1 class I SAM-dependent methyltransferase [Pectobacterium quasiaquaticum]MBE5208815.1 class I SAM-dependent methyltransferase [Pectobacterium quasiaquaticum]MBE5223049.1 class I SAM-dependent methyltransferase [Pectobacterium quasiaquaticum]MBN3062849.1 class I SAM-dependent methyltransferase [Pectobacterium aquaticum]URG50865.1 class I SAM-dependent methyltransferase [Pectobacterium quasia
MSSTETQLVRHSSNTALYTRARKVVFLLLSRIEGGGLRLRDPEGNETLFGDRHAALQGDITIHHHRVYRRVLLGGSIAAGESYIDGDWSSPNLTLVLQLLAQNQALVDTLETRFGWLTRPFHRFIHWCRRNRQQQAQKNIAAHYDLGNHFYRSFLDSEMLYSSAWYQQPEMTLEDAQRAKLRRLCEQLALCETDHLLEIGTGWGGLAELAAREYGCHVTTTTLSQQQYDYAVERIQQAGLSHKVTVLLQDYRALTGQYDKLVSVEMIEAVGKAYLPTFFKRCQQLLRPQGRMVLQAITIADQRYSHYCRNVDFIQRYIFPGGFLPSITAMTTTMTRHTDFITRDLFDIGQDYARTLSEWRQRFYQQWHMLNAQGFDEPFQRLWVFYLCYCEAGFRARTISTVQLTAERP